MKLAFSSSSSHLSVSCRVVACPPVVSDRLFAGSLGVDPMEASPRAHRCTCSDASFAGALAGSGGALLQSLSAALLAGWLWLWLCCSRAGCHPPTHSTLATPTPTACRAICSEGRSPCLSRLASCLSRPVCPWFALCRRLCMPAVSHCSVSRAVVRPLCYASCYRQQLAPATRQVCFLSLPPHTMHTPAPYHIIPAHA